MEHLQIDVVRFLLQVDLQVLERNPLEDIRNTNSLRYVMKNGRLYDANTLKELAPREKPLDKMWWMVP